MKTWSKQCLFVMMLCFFYPIQSNIENTEKNSITAIDYRLDYLLDAMANDNSWQASEKAKEYDAALKSGKVVFELEEINALLPELIAYLEELETREGLRAPRIDAPAATANDAVVGKNVCDLTQVLVLLSMIKKRIEILQQVICEKFNQTFTILADIQETITEEFFNTNTIVCQKFNETWTILAAGFACNTEMPISEPIVITESGSYCLTQDIVGTIVIDADQVFLDLNEKSITGASNAIEVSNHSDIVIRNGIIRNGDPNGILVTTCTNVTIDHVDFIANTRGVFVSTATNIQISNSSFRESTNFTEIIRCDNSNNGIIQQCIIDHNQAVDATVSGIHLFNSFNFQISDCTITNNQAINSADFFLIRFQNVFDSSITQCKINRNQMVGLAGTLNVIDISSGSDGCTIDLCHIINNISNDILFEISTNQNNIIKNSIISNNVALGGIGISVFAGQNSILDCIIENNVEHIGIRLLGSDTNYVANNIIRNNGDFGILNSATPSIFISNRAQGHSTNFSGVDWPIAVFSLSMAMYTTTPSTALDNISVVP